MLRFAQHDGVIGIILSSSLMAFFYLIAKDSGTIGWVLLALQGIILLGIIWGIFKTIGVVLQFRQLYIHLDNQGLLYGPKNQLILWDEIKEVAVRKYKRMKWVDIYFEPSGTVAKKLLRLHDGFKPNSDQLCELIKLWQENCTKQENINSNESVSGLLP
jgi:hypothetical protein